MTDVIASSLNSIKVCEHKGKANCTLKWNSKLLDAVLDQFQKNGYIEKYDVTGPQNKQNITIKLSGKINKCGAVKPRFFVKNDEWENWEVKYLPAKGVGILVVTTPNGVMTQEEAKAQKLGGRLLAYVY